MDLNSTIQSVFPLLQLALDISELFLFLLKLVSLVLDTRLFTLQSGTTSGEPVEESNDTLYVLICPSHKPGWTSP